MLKKLLEQEKFNYNLAGSDYLVGKSSLVSTASMRDETNSYLEISFGQGEPLWEEICHGNSEPFIDKLLEIEPENIN